MPYEFKNPANAEVAERMKEHLKEGTLWNRQPTLISYNRLVLVDHVGVNARAVPVNGWVEDLTSVSFAEVEVDDRGKIIVDQNGNFVVKTRHVVTREVVDELQELG